MASHLPLARTSISLLACTFLVSISGQSLASDTLNQDVTIAIQDVAQLALVGTGTQTFILDIALTPGAAPTIAKDIYDRYLQFTSITPANETRAIQAQLTSPAPTGLALRLSTNASSGTGAVGTSQHTTPGVGGTILSTTPTTMVSGIGTGYTGSGATDGLLLDYYLSMTEDFDQVHTGTHNLDVTFTLAATP